jgi:hypothetical protein
MAKPLVCFVLLAGLLLLALSRRAGADPVECTGECTMHSVNYSCKSKKATVYELTDCFYCKGDKDEKGWQNCQKPAIRSGGSCEQEIERGKAVEITTTIYPSGFEVCPGACNTKNVVDETPTYVQGFPTSTKGDPGSLPRYTCVRPVD